MHNKIFTIGSFTLYGYGLMIGIGIIVAYLVAEYRARKYKIDDEPIISILLYAVLIGFVSAKLLYYITVMDEIIANPGILLDVANGFVVYGGIIGGVAAVYVYAKIKKINFLIYLDLLIPSVALAQGFGRIGCLLAGCCYGVKMNSMISIVFTHSDFAPNGIALFPTQIISSIFDFVNFFVLCRVYRKNRIDGRIGALYLIFYSVGRFIIEFFRGDLIRGNVGNLSTSQFISVLVAIVGMVMLIILKKNSAKAR